MSVGGGDSGNTARCGNTIHSDYVSDHRCLRVRGHAGDCAFGCVSGAEPPPAPSEPGQTSEPVRANERQAHPGSVSAVPAQAAELRALILEAISTPDATKYGAQIRNRGRAALDALLARVAEAVDALLARVAEAEEKEAWAREKWMHRNASVGQTWREVCERAERAEAKAERLRAENDQLQARLGVVLAFARPVDLQAAELHIAKNGLVQPMLDHLLSKYRKDDEGRGGDTG